MANKRRYGFREFQNKSGEGAPLMHYSVATGYDGQDGSGNSVVIRPGDPVKRVNTGTIALAGAGDEVLGIVQEIEAYWNGTAMTRGKNLPNQNTWGTVEARRPWIGIKYAKSCIWECDFDEIGSSWTSPIADTYAGYFSAIGSNFDHVLTGDTTNTTAQPEINGDTLATTDATWRMEGISPTFDNKDYTTVYVKGLFVINESEEGGSAAAGALYAGI